MMIMMPFMFISGALPPLETVPGWMQALAAFNPVAQATDALRANMLGTATIADTTAALAGRRDLVARRHRCPRPTPP
jgi:ABC-2 type transport system permease protein